MEPKSLQLLCRLHYLQENAYNGKHIKEVVSKFKHKVSSENSSYVLDKESSSDAAAETELVSRKRHWKKLRLYIKVISHYKQSCFVDRKSILDHSDSNEKDKHKSNGSHAQKYNSVSINTLNKSIYVMSNISLIIKKTY